LLDNVSAQAETKLKSWARIGGWRSVHNQGCHRWDVEKMVSCSSVA